MKKKFFCLLMAIIFAFTPILFAGCGEEIMADLEEDFNEEFGGGSGGSSEGSSDPFISHFYNGFKVVYSESQIEQENNIDELTYELYDNALLIPLTNKYGSGKGETTFFPDAIRQTIIRDDAGKLSILNDVPTSAYRWNWTLNDNAGTAVNEIKDQINGEVGLYYNDWLGFTTGIYPSLSDSKYYSTPIQIVLFETMLGYEQTTFEVESGEGKPTNYPPLPIAGELRDVVQDYFIIKVKTSPKADLVGEIVYSYKFVYTIKNDQSKDEVEDYSSKQETPSQEILNYLNGLKAQYYNTATYSGLTKADADELITYILNEVIGEDVVEYDHNTLRTLTVNGERVNYRNYVGTVAEMIYKAVYDGSDEFVYTYKTDEIEVEYDFIADQKAKRGGEEIEEGVLKAELYKEASFRPKTASYLRDYNPDMFFSSANAFEGLEGATSFENSPMSEYQSVALMPKKDNSEFGGMWMLIFAPNPDLAITVRARFWAYNPETGKGQLFEWVQDEINFYQSEPIDGISYEESNDEQEYVPGKGYLQKTTEKDNDGNPIEGYCTAFEVSFDITGVPPEFAIEGSDDPYAETMTDKLILSEFKNTESDPKLKADDDEVNGITEVALGDHVKKDGENEEEDSEEYAYKVIPSKNGFGGVTVLDENQIEFSFYELVFDIQKDPTLTNTNYDYKLAIWMVF